MARKRSTFRWGNSSVILLKPSDLLDLDIKVGEDMVDIEEMVVLKGEMKKQGVGRNYKK